MLSRTKPGKYLVTLLALGIMSCWGTLLAEEIQPGRRPQIDKTEKRPQKEAPSKGPVPESASQGRHEEIKVHGHWIIDVRDPDGTLAIHREFENSLLGAPASQALVGVLSRAQSVGLWTIVLNNPNGADPCPNFCHIIEANSTFAASNSSFKNLIVGTASNGTQLVLSGNATASQDGSISNVVTQTRDCTSSILPANCLENVALPLSPLTGTSISPIAVFSGQIVQVTVTISFS